MTSSNTNATGPRIYIDDLHEIILVLGVSLPVSAPSYRHSRNSTIYYEENAFDGVAYQSAAHITSSVDEDLVRARI